MDIQAHEEGFSEMQAVKRRFFALRNGVISDVLRKAGSPFQVVFGLNYPQLKEVAAFVGENEALADALWGNSTTRESMLLAPMVHPADTMTREKAEVWLSGSRTEEVADILCKSLLRRLPFAEALAFDILEREGASRIETYGALRLLMNILPSLSAERVRSAAAHRVDDYAVARQIIEELDFIANT